VPGVENNVPVEKSGVVEVLRVNLHRFFLAKKSFFYFF
jgi:hypothetical protein